MSKKLSSGMSAAINHIYKAVKPWELTPSQNARLKLAQNGNAGALCDLLAELGMTEAPEVQEFYGELDGMPDDSDEMPASYAKTHNPAEDDADLPDEDKIREAMSLLGRRKTERKTKTARENGKNGGRPRKDGKGREKAK